MTASRTATRPKRPATRQPPPSRRRVQSSRAVVLMVSGALWAVFLIVGDSIATWTAAAVVLPVAVVATASVGPRRRSRRQPKVPPLLLAGLGASVVLPLAALGGPVAAIVALCVAAGGIAFVLVTRPTPGANLVSSLVAALGPAVAAMSVVLARGQGTNEGVALVVAVCAYDMAAFLMGNSRTPLGGPIGVAAGWVSVAVVGLFATAVMDPPFSGSRTIVMFGLIALLAPAGVIVSSWLPGPFRRPALRRLDSLMLAAPAWVLAVTFVLHR